MMNTGAGSAAIVSPLAAGYETRPPHTFRAVAVE